MQNVDIGVVWQLGVAKDYFQQNHTIERIRLPIKLQ